MCGAQSSKFKVESEKGEGRERGVRRSNYGGVDFGHMILI